MSNQSYDFNLSVGIQEILDADSAAKVESQVQKQKQKMEEPVEIKVELNIGEAKAQIKELQKEMTIAANNIKKIQNKKKGLGKSDYNDIAKYNSLLDSNQRKIDGIVAQLKSQGAAVRTATKEYKELQTVLEEIGYVEKKKTTSAPRKQATSEVKKQTAAEKEHASAAAEAVKETKNVESAVKKTTSAVAKFTQQIDKLTKKYGKASFTNIFGGVLSSFSSIDESNAIQVYDALIAKDKEYQKELKAESKLREARGREMQAFVNMVNPVESEITASTEGTKEFAQVMNELSAGSLTAAQAMDRLQKYLGGVNQESLNTSGIKKETEAINELAKAQQKLQERQTNLQHGNEHDYFRKGAFYSGKQGRLNLARNVAYDISEFNLSNSDLDKLVASTYDEFSKIRSLLVDRETWVNEINKVLRESQFTKQLSSQYSMDEMNAFRKNDDVAAIYHQVSNGALSVADALEKVKKISSELNAIPKNTSTSEIQSETAALEKNTQAVKKNAAAKKELSNVVYHAGDLSNIEHTQKSFPLGYVNPTAPVKGGAFGGLTGLYTTEDLDGFWANEWAGAPVSTIDLSQYNLFDAKDNRLAGRVKTFFDNLNGTIYGYLEYFDAESGELSKITNVKTVKALYSQLKSTFKGVTMDFDTFAAFIQRAQNLVKGHNFADIEMPAIDQGVAKSGVGRALQGVSSDVFQMDSFATQLMKKMGFEGIDLRNTKYNGTYTGGTVIFDIKPSSLNAVNEKWSDVMGRDPRFKDQITDQHLEYEEKRRQLAFETAKAYSDQAAALSVVDERSKDVVGQTQILESRVRNIVNAANQIPQEPNTTRFVHFTSDTNNKAILENGLALNAGMLQSHAVEIQEYAAALENGVDTVSRAVNVLQSHGGIDNAVIMDIPTEAIRAYDDAVGGLPTVHNAFIKAVVNTEKGLINLNQAYDASHDVIADYKKEIHAAREEEQKLNSVRPGVKRSDSLTAGMQRITAGRLAEFDKEDITQWTNAIPEGEYRDKFHAMYNDVRQKVVNGVLNIGQAWDEINTQFIDLANVFESESVVLNQNVRKMSNGEYQAMLKGVNFDKLFKEYNITRQDDQNAIYEEIAKLGDIIVSGNGDADAQIENVVGSIIDFAQVQREDYTTTMQDLAQELRNQGKILYDGDLKKRIGKGAWSDISNSLGKMLTQSGRLSKSKPDQFYQNLSAQLKSTIEGIYQQKYGAEFNGNEANILTVIADIFKSAEIEKSKQYRALDSSETEYLRQQAAGLIGQSVNNVEQLIEKEKELAAAAEQTNGIRREGNRLIEEGANTTQKPLQLEGAEDAEKVTEPIVNAYRELEDVIGVISSAAGKDAATKFLSGMTDQSQFKDRLSDYFSTVLQDAGPWRLKSGKGAIVTQDDIATVHLFNEVTQDTVDLVFQLQDGILKLAKGPKFGLTNAEPFDIESARKLAEIQVRDLKANLGGRSYDGMGQLEGALGNIADPKSLEEFNNQLKIAKEEVKALKKEYASGSGSLNDFSRAGTVMRNSAEEVAKLRDQLKLVGNVDGVERATDAINRMEDAARAFNEAQDEAGQKTAYQQYNEAHADYNVSYERAKKAQQVASAEAKAEAQQVEQENQKIEQYYKSILDTVNKINSLDSKLNELKIKDGGTGLYSGVIQSLETDKAKLIDRLNQIGNEINQEFQGVFTLTGDVKLPMGTFLDDLNTGTPSTLSDFLNDTRVQAALTTEQMDKLVQSFKNSQNIKFDFASKIVEQLRTAQQAMEQLRSISDPDSSDAILSRDSAGYQQAMQAYQYLAALQQSFGNDTSKWSSEQVAAFAKAAKAATDYANAAQQAAQQEAKYFSGKTKYKSGDTMYGDPNENALVKVGDATKNLDPAREKLESFVKEFTNGQGIITNFVTTANGISKIDFSVFDEVTGQFRTFTAEIGKATSNIFYDESSMNNLTAGTTAAQQALARLQEEYSKLQNLGAGVDVSEYSSSLLNQIQQISEKLNAVGNVKDVGSQTMLKNMAAEANKTMQEIAKLEKGWLKVQDAIDSGKVNKLGVADKAGDIEAQLTSMAQMSDTARGATFAVQSFDAQTNTLTYTLTSANGTVKTMTVSMDQLTGTVTENAGKVSQLQTAWGKFASSFSGIGQKIKNYLGYMISVQSVIRVFKSGLNSVLEIDSALLELKKVTDETEETYSKFLSTMAQSGAKVGSTMKDLTTSAADWARLGYSIEEAGRLAENTMMLMNVSEFDNVADATDSLISAIQAFNTDSADAGSFSLKIIDEMNQVGNNYAISTSDLASSLTRSSAALVAANNSLEESIALTTAANTTIQNPEAVGNALKTVSMRIRGRLCPSII